MKCLTNRITLTSCLSKAITLLVDLFINEGQRTLSTDSNYKPVELRGLSSKIVSHASQITCVPRYCRISTPKQTLNYSPEVFT